MEGRTTVIVRTVYFPTLLLVSIEVAVKLLRLAVTLSGSDAELCRVIVEFVFATTFCSQDESALEAGKLKLYTASPACAGLVAGAAAESGKLIAEEYPVSVAADSIVVAVCPAAAEKPEAGTVKESTLDPSAIDCASVGSRFDIMTFG